MSVEDFKPGNVIESPSKTLTDAHFLFFSGLTGDNHPIHYDLEYAKKTKFRRPVAHGLLLASMTALGASQASHRLRGFVFVEQGCRFLRPAFVGDTIYPRATVKKVWRERGRHFVRFETELLNQRAEILLKGFHVYCVQDGAETTRAGRRAKSPPVREARDSRAKTKEIH